MPDNEAERHHVVTVAVADRADLRLLARRGLDLFGSTARVTGDGAAIDGRLREGQIAALRQDGYEVRVHPDVETPPLQIAPDGVRPRLAAGPDAVPVGYASARQIMDTVWEIGTNLPGVGSVIELPEPSVRGNQIVALRLRGGTTQNRPGVLILGGVHARELAPSEILNNWMFRMAYSISAKMPINYPTGYDYNTVSLLVNTLDIFIVPVVNPDGRDYVMAGNRWWRKNLANLPVDLNRNYDFLFDSGIGTSTNPADDVYRGPFPFSEPETRNIRWLLDTFPHIQAALDLHSFSERILYPWGDDDNQTADPAQNFRVPNPDRGLPNDGLYREYIPSTDLNWFVRASNRMQAAISKNRGRNYLVQQSVGLYPTTGTVDDYSFSRHFVNPALGDVHLICIEVGQAPATNSDDDVLGAFQPPYDEVMQLRQDIGPALMEFLLEVSCPSGSDAALIRSGQEVLERHLADSGENRDLYDGLVAQGPRILQALGEHPRARVLATTAVKRLVALSEDEHDPLLDQDVADKLGQAATTLAEAIPESRELLEAFAKLVTGAAGNRLSSLLAD